MNTLPLVLQNIIIDYKYQLDHTEKWYFMKDYIENIDETHKAKFCPKCGKYVCYTYTNFLKYPAKKCSTIYNITCNKLFLNDKRRCELLYFDYISDDEIE